ncbi:hypothetical protein SCLCIDRAFT_24715 [Scleroderma citrinum Foug A]|uniref:Uncharacterized protein n=1 Tax=Scleroderma citrinum Foug A TaxID=1036808 RepID=A0A0C2ZMT9_9AGAM|nr:hypothetical protein SCLCIDRAFT_24715 [Scleroderma citrinum Foug A]
MASASEPVSEPEHHACANAEPSAASAITALMNSRYPGGTAFSNISKHNRGCLRVLLISALWLLDWTLEAILAEALS